jgi:hypothetical protein
MLVLLLQSILVYAADAPRAVSVCSEILQAPRKSASMWRSQSSPQTKRDIQAAVKKRDLAVLALEDYKIRATVAFQEILKEKSSITKVEKNPLAAIKKLDPKKDALVDPALMALRKELKKRNYEREFEEAQDALDSLAASSMIHGFSCSIAGILASYSSQPLITGTLKMRPSQTHHFKALEARSIADLEAIGDAETLFCIARVAEECQWLNEVPRLDNPIWFSEPEQEMLKSVTAAKTAADIKKNTPPSNAATPSTPQAVQIK